MSNRHIAIVDPYSSGAMLAQALQARNVDCVAILSSSRIPAFMRSRFDRGAFAEVIEHNDDLDATIAAVKRYDPSHVVAGSESGVLLADQLSERLALPTNGTTLSLARRDKYLMGEAVRRQGLRVPTAYVSRHVPSILVWIRESLEWPIIVKPPRSVASDHVVLCTSENDVRRAAEAILTAPNVLGEANATVLAQQYLHGTEYVVDTVSYRGCHQATAFWQYHRPVEDRLGVGYDAMTLLPYRGERQNVMEAYAFDVLDALGIRFGPAHCEIMWADGGPCLIEVGARLSAGINAVLSRLCGGICQLDATVDTLTAPERFLAGSNQEPRLTRGGGNMFLLPGRSGRLTRLTGVDIIESLPTLHSMSISATPGDPVSRVAGVVTLIGEEAEQVERDMDIIRDLVRNGLFEMEPERDN